LDSFVILEGLFDLCYVHSLIRDTFRGVVIHETSL